MGAMTIAEAWPTTRRAFTVDDLDRTPDDCRRYELVDGVLIVSPAPAIPHQEVVAALLVLLRQACPRGVRVLPGPGVRMSLDTELIPDIVAVRFDSLGGTRITEAPLLAVEVQSQSTKVFDRTLKKAAYERFGVESYWIVVPDADKPELIVFELRDDRYEQVAHVAGDEGFRAERPFAVEVVPSRLVIGLLPD